MASSEDSGTALFELGSGPASQQDSGGGSLSEEVRNEALSLGADETVAERVAEAAVRRSQARQEGRVFLYIDAEYELEDLHRRNGASHDEIWSAKQKVWSAAREISAEHGCSMEEALFFCYREAADVYRQSLAAQGADASAA